MTEKHNQLTLAIFGQTGSGKTSLSNVLFGLNWLTDDAVACTKAVSEYIGTIRPCLSGSQTSIWRLLDTPGIDESETADEKNFQTLYENFHSAHIILWVVQADIRAFAKDQTAILRLTDDGKKIPKSHFVIALNQIDRVYPENWNFQENKPSKEQNSIIKEKVRLVFKRFSKYLPISKKQIVPCSVIQEYGLVELVHVLSCYKSNKSLFERIKGWIKKTIKKSKNKHKFEELAMFNWINKLAGKNKKEELPQELRDLLGEDLSKKLLTALKTEKKEPPRIAVIGQSGVGKSTTINSLFKLRQKVSHTTTGTLEASENTIDLPQGGKLSVIDLPGLGEDIELDQKYQDIYRKVLPSADVVLYVLQADMRALKMDQEILRDIVQNVMGDLKNRLVVGLNQVDKISPGNWNEKLNRPSPEQEDNIKRRCEDAQQKLNESLSIKVEQIEYYSALKRYRMYPLLTAIIKAAGDMGWKFPIEPADPIELAAPEAKQLLREQQSNNNSD